MATAPARDRVTAEVFAGAAPPAGLRRFVREILEHHPLVEALVRRELKARYQGLGLGYLWGLVNPLLMLAVYSFVFSLVLGSPIRDFVPFLACGLLPWIWFQGALVAGANAILTSGPLLRRRYLPAQILPLVPVLSHLVHFLMSLPILVLLLWISGRGLSVALLLLPLLLALQFGLTFGLTLALSALSVRFRDIGLILNNFLIVLFFMAPIAYPWESVPERIRPLLLLNPFTLLAHSYQNIFFFGRWPFWNEVWALAGMAALALLAGAAVFEARRWKFPEQV